MKKALSWRKISTRIWGESRSPKTMILQKAALRHAEKNDLPIPPGQLRKGPTLGEQGYRMRAEGKMNWGDIGNRLWKKGSKPRNPMAAAVMIAKSWAINHKKTWPISRNRQDSGNRQEGDLKMQSISLEEFHETLFDGDTLSLWLKAGGSGGDPQLELEIEQYLQLAQCLATIERIANISTKHLDQELEDRSHAICSKMDTLYRGQVLPKALENILTQVRA